MNPKPITILDGGMGKHLLRIGAPFRQPEWSALPLLEDPSFVTHAHKNFIEAGARLIITNVYGVVPYHLGPERFEEQGTELAQLAAQLARQVADEAQHPVRVAGSIPPLYGSYEPELYRPADGPEAWAELITSQMPYVDHWLGETVSSIAEAHGILDSLENAGNTKPVWISFCLNNNPPATGATLVSTESLAEAQAAVLARGVSGILFNCCAAEVIAPALRELSQLLGDRADQVTTGGYANSFLPTDDREYKANEKILEHRADLDPARYAEIAQDWARAGATVIGGCCGIHPEHIEELARLLG